jgi:hypothetical protein
MKEKLFDRRYKAKRISLQVAVILLVAVYLFISTVSTTMAAVIRSPSSNLHQASFRLDGVTLNIAGNFIPGKFTVSSPDNMTQMASDVATQPYREFQIESIPFKTSASEEKLPIARSGDESQYRALLHKIRISQGANTLSNSPSLHIFNKMVKGEMNILQLPLYGKQLKPVIMNEYVIEAGQRLWLVRVTQEQDSGVKTENAIPSSFLNSIAQMNISSSTLNHPSTHVAAILSEAKRISNMVHNTAVTKHGKVSPSSWSDPSWWGGATCDSTNYYNSSGWSSWQMNSGYRGVYPCGPRPGFGGPDVSVNFYPGAWGEYEWECVELSMRWLYLYNDVAPYAANGNTVVSNYSGSDLNTYSNYAGCCGTPQPGDVLSYCPTCTYGHTSVVISNSVDGNGNGSITVMEQNASQGGSQQLSVSNYEVLNAPEGFVSGWLSIY